MGVDFQQILQCFGIKDVPTSVHNPQSIAICERLHLRQDIPFNVGNIAELVNSALATPLHALRSTIHCTLRMTPGGPEGSYSSETCFSTFLFSLILQYYNTNVKSWLTTTCVVPTTDDDITITNLVMNV
jgi:hypothetical protein